MVIQQIRNATLKIKYGGITFLIDPWFQDQGTGFSAKAVKPEMQGIKCPMNALPDAPERILTDVDYCLVTHLHFDHFSLDYLPVDLRIIAQNDEDAEKIREMGFAIKLDTNGNHPDMLEKMISEGLVDYVAMDIKNSPEKYAVTCGLETLDLTKIRQSVEILKSGRVDYEFRTTVVAQFHEENDFRLIGQWLQGAKRYFLQSFTDRDSVPYGGMSAPSREEIFRYAQIAQENIPDTQVRGVD